MIYADDFKVKLASFLNSPSQTFVYLLICKSLWIKLSAK